MLLMEIQVYERQVELLRQAADERLAAEATGTSPGLSDALRKLGTWWRTRSAISHSKSGRTPLAEAMSRVRI
jgi:hypothetical protein